MIYFAPSLCYLLKCPRQNIVMIVNCKWSSQLIFTCKWSSSSKSLNVLCLYRALFISCFVYIVLFLGWQSPAINSYIRTASLACYLFQFVVLIVCPFVSLSIGLWATAFSDQWIVSSVIECVFKGSQATDVGAAKVHRKIHICQHVQGKPRWHPSTIGLRKGSKLICCGWVGVQ